MEVTLSTLNLHPERFERIVARLEDEFPWQPVHPKESIESIMYRSGQASVIARLKTLLDEE